MNPLASLGIDFTSLILYIVNFGIIVFFIGKYMTGPLIDMLEKRKSLIKNNLSEAEMLKVEMTKQKKILEEEKVLMQKKLQQESELIKTKGSETVAQLLKSAEDKKAEILKEAHDLAEKQKDQIVANSEKEIKTTVKKMISYIVSNKIPEDLIKESVSEAWEISFQNKK